MNCTMRGNSSRKLAQRLPHRRFAGIIRLSLISYLISISTSHGQQQQLQNSEQQPASEIGGASTTINVPQHHQHSPSKQATNPTATASNKIGQAPHDRPACQLPPMSPQRRHHLQQQQQQHLQSILSTGSADQIDPELSKSPVNSSTKSATITSNYLSVAHPAILMGLSSSFVGAGAQQAAETAAATTLGGKRFDSSERLRQLRQLLASNNYDAYLVTPNDEHGSEYVSDYDRRLRFISGFTGSNGYALVLLDRAVLFTDGRYALQADQDLDCNWWLVVSDEPLQDIHLWLKANAANGLKIATDARLMSLQSFDYLDEHIKRLESEFALISQDLIDVVWNTNAASGGGESARPKPQDRLFIHPLPFAGNITWQEKLVRLSDSMGKLRAKHYIISQLDDIAWLLNLRGNDIPMTPLFKAYALVSRSLPASGSTGSNHALSSVEQLLAGSGGRAQVNANQPQPGASVAQQANLLQAPQVLQVEPGQSIKVTLYVDLQKIDQQIRDHLHLDNGTIVVHSKSQPAHPLPTRSTAPPPMDALAAGSQDHQAASMVATTRIQVELKDHDVFIMDIRDKLNPGAGSRQLQGRLLLNAGANVAIHVLAKGYEDRLVLVESLVNKLKAVKSDGEVQGMRLAHWRDSLAISMLLAQLDSDIGRRAQTNKWTEVSAAQELEFYRSLMDYNRGQSFETISAFGSNGAIVHYAPNHSDDNPRPIGNSSTYLLDSGGQYLDGTTDITRTTHYGEPSEFQRETYTRVLMGSIDMMSLIFDQPIRGAYRLNDMLARRHLFELGLDYAHGTGHGIGLYSLVHEAPALIENYATSTNAKRQQQASSSTNKQQSLVHSEPVPLQANMFTSVEPGYYKANDFGIRLENIVVTQRVNLPASLARPNDRQAEQLDQMKTGERQFLRFEPLSLVPFEPKLIKWELLSNKQKAWLNSYNLMIRLRMTQQINYYLNKIRAHQAQPIHSVQYTGSRLFHQHHQMMQHKPQLATGGSGQPAAIVSGSLQVLNGTASFRSSDLERSGQYNFLRLEGSQLQEKLEMTHRWIMSKTELIPLDVPQSLVNTSQQQQQHLQQQQQVVSNVGPNGGGSQQQQQQARAQSSVEGSRKRSHEQHQPGQQGQNLDSQKLMLVYMASLPFNDHEAGEAAAAAAAFGDDSSSPLLLAGRRAAAGKSTGTGSSASPDADHDAAPSGGQPSSSAANLAAGNKCTGFECDLWLLGSLNRATSAQSSHRQHQLGGGGGSLEHESSSSSIDDQTDEASGLNHLLGSGSLKAPLGAGSILDLFQIHGSPAGSSLPINMWSMIVFGLLIVLQLGIVSFMCQRGGHGSRRAGSATLCQPNQVTSPLAATTNN